MNRLQEMAYNPPTSKTTVLYRLGGCVTCLGPHRRSAPSSPRAFYGKPTSRSDARLLRIRPSSGTSWSCCSTRSRTCPMRRPANAWAFRGVRSGVGANGGPLGTFPWRILETDARKPWRYKYWIFPRDPYFAEKAGPILDLYAGMWQGQPLGPRDYILSADEKISIQARIRCHCSLPPAPRRPAYIENEYARGGALQYLAAWDVRRGYVMGRCEQPHGLAPFGRLVQPVLAEEPYHSSERLFWIVDNGSSHRGKAAKKRLRQVDSRIILVHTPIHASWLNQVEIYFSIIQRKVLTPNDFANLEAVRLRLALYEELSNQCPTPFQWKFDRTKLAALLAKIEARQRVLEDAQFTCLQEAA